MSEFGDDILDLRDIMQRFDTIVQRGIEDEDEAEYVFMVGQLEGQLWTSLAEYAKHEPSMILDTYFERYAEEFANDIGSIDSQDGQWPTSHINWEAAADDLKQDYTEYEIGQWTYYGRNY